MTRIVQCPTCQRSVPWEPAQKWRPFCSERCRLIDLGEWADENRRIPERGGVPWEELGEDPKDH